MLCGGRPIAPERAHHCPRRAEHGARARDGRFGLRARFRRSRFLRGGCGCASRSSVVPGVSWLADMRRILVASDVEAALKGGAVLAAGGGGFADHGRMLGTAAVNAGRPELVSMDEVPDEAWIATAAAIGAPAGTTQWQMLGVDYVRAVKLAQRELGEPIHGLIIGQNGKSSTLNGWLPSAILGTKVVDAVGD